MEPINSMKESKKIHNESFVEDLNLPIIKGEDIFNKKYLSMDDYLKFILFNLEYTVDIKAAREWKKKLVVNVPFKWR